jgi:hypothetical protein
MVGFPATRERDGLTARQESLAVEKVRVIRVVSILLAVRQKQCVQPRVYAQRKAASP